MLEKFYLESIMPIDFAYILAAGKGTRMGEIGKVLPKPLWPIFEKSLLELQVLWCLSLGVKKIYVNAHFHGDLVQKEMDRVSALYDVQLKVLHEDPLLDSGGCIHNLAQQKEIQYRGKFLLVNSDQFYFFSKKFMTDALSVFKTKDTPAVLFSLKVGIEDNYNETVLEDDGKLMAIEKVSAKEEYLTYSGLGIIDLERLVPVQGVSKFFESVADYKKKNIYFITPDKAEYWDFGTSPLFVKNIKKVLSSKKINLASEFVSFLEESQALKNEKINSLSYQNFFMNDGFDLEAKGRCEKDKIRYREIIQEV